MPLASGVNVFPAWQSLFTWQPETQPYPYASAFSTVPTIVGTTFVPFCDLPEIVEDEGSKNIYGIASRDAQADVAGIRNYDLNPFFHIADLDLLANLIGPIATDNGTPVASGEFGLPDLTFFSGAWGPNHFLNVYRYCKVNNLNFNWAEGQELKARANIWSLGKQIGAENVAQPGADALSPALSPMMWHNLSIFTIRGTNYRDQLAALNFSLNNQLERRGDLPDQGDNEPRSRSCLMLVPRTQVCTLELTLHSPQLVTSLVSDAANSTSWPSVTGDHPSPALQLTVSNSANVPAGFSTTTLTINIANARLGRKVQSGGGSDSTMGSVLTVLARGITATVVTSPAVTSLAIQAPPS